MKRNTAILLFFLLCLAAALPAAGFPPTARAAGQTLYVSPDGSDGAAGTEDEPLATLAGAKEKAKTLTGAATVYFREGVYTLNESVVFDASDKADVTYAAYPGERAVLTAGAPYAGFTEDTVNGVRAFRKDVGDADFNVLFSAERALARPRYPEDGFLRVKERKDADVDDLSASSLFYACRGFAAAEGDVPEFKNASDVVVRILHYWKDEMTTVKGFDADTGRLTLSRPTSMTVNAGDRYFFENVFEALNEPGEWYLDRAEGTLWYIPFEGEEAETLTLWGSDVETMIRAEGLNGLTFEDLVFRGSGFCIPRNDTERDLSSQAAYDAAPCLAFEHCENVRLQNCEFRDIAACAVYFGDAARDCAVDSCLFERIGAQAVFIRGQNVPADDPLVTKGIRVTNNLVDGYGRVFFNAVGILVIHANSVEVSHNEIRDGYYTAISCGWSWGYDYSVTCNNRICDNLIYDIGQGWLSDMGGIYTLGVQTGTVLSGNVIHNVAADAGQGGYGGWGIYLDEGSSGILVEKNLVFACGSESYHLHYGENNVVRNNIFALSSYAQIRAVSRYEGHKTADFTNNIILTDGKAPVFVNAADPNAFTAEGNVFWDVTNGDELYVTQKDALNDALTLKAAVKQGLIGENTVADPLFRDPLAFDFTLDPASPAIAQGFEPWDYNEAGTLPGAPVGLSATGGETAYNAGAAAAARGKGASTAKRTLRRAGLLLAAALVVSAAILACVRLKRRGKNPLAALPVLALLPLGAAMYHYFVHWSPVLYVIILLLCSLAAAYLPALLRGEKRRRGAFFALAAAAFFAAIFAVCLVFNNALRIGEPNAVTVMLTVGGALTLAAVAAAGGKDRNAAADDRKEP